MEERNLEISSVSGGNGGDVQVREIHAKTREGHVEERKVEMGSVDTNEDGGKVRWRMKLMEGDRSSLKKNG